ncbi:hypothetical protein RHAB21_02507 [Pseudorhizobium halotolerans]|uniref:Uncharacterized protein n=1 Tax=Pseudorhizobium halotolerans TaxID=1233081 RepID=A0ABM8PLG9_9HYPH|nr:hypothetical protein [Pseudorhizobium halotolerans]CAD7036299.1 hypothetical protein RHAB21_02507 [Pseudorhizobium halotolerans]
MTDDLIKIRYDDLGMFPAAEIQDKLAVVRAGLPGNVSLSQILALFTDGAPQALDTWLEVVAKLADNDDALAALVATVGTKANSSDVASALALKQDSSGELFRGHIQGLTLSNNGSDSANDIDVAPGAAGSDGSTPVLMTLAATTTKRLDAAWAPGSGNGGWLDGTTMPNGTGHAFLIQRSDTGVVDVGFSASLSPTLPTSYDRSRRIGSVIRAGGALLGFSQQGDDFLLSTPVSDANALNPGSSAVLRALTVPTGIKVDAYFVAAVRRGSSAGDFAVLLTSPDQADSLPSDSNFSLIHTTSSVANGGEVYTPGTFRIRTNTSGQIRTRLNSTNANFQLRIITHGWIDRRGRN